MKNEAHILKLMHRRHSYDLNTFRESPPTNISLRYNRSFESSLAASCTRCSMRDTSNFTC